MKKNIILFIIVYIVIGNSFSLTLAQGGPPPPPTPHKDTPCEKWSKTETGKTSGKVCTDLLEGIPCATLDGGGCQSDQTCAADGIGKKDASGNPVPGTAETCYAVISPTGVDAFTSFIAMGYRYASWAIGILAVLMIIIGGIQMSIGGANQEQVTAGKKRIFQAIGGVVLFFLIGVILHTINPNFFK